MPLHPDLEAFLELVNLGEEDGGRRAMSDMRPDEARAAYDQSTLALDAPGHDLSAEDLTLPCRDGHRLPARLYRGPASHGPQPVALFFHGGGYVLGGLASHDSLCRDLAWQTPCAVLAIDYRLAPEHRFPTAFFDAEDAHTWLLAHGAQHGLDTHRIALVGDSVGGSLCAALAIAARDAGHPQPLLQLLLYPCTSAVQDSESHRRHASGFLLEAKTLQWMFGHYLRDDHDRHDWRFAPLQATSLRDLAPAHIVLAEHDPLVDEGQAYARRLRDAGVPTTLDLFEGMVHDFARLGNVVAETTRLRTQLAQALARAFQPACQPSIRTSATPASALTS